MAISIAKSFKLLVSIIICLGAGWTGSLFTRPAVRDWYPDLVKPVFNPPSWVFAPVWTVLYILMGISLFLVWKRGISAFRTRMALVVFMIQLVLNASWSIVFFGFHSIAGGLIVISLLWVFIILTIYLFEQQSRAAMWLLVPYLAWVSFALFLNLSIWFLNS